MIPIFFKSSFFLNGTALTPSPALALPLKDFFAASLSQNGINDEEKQLFVPVMESPQLTHGKAHSQQSEDTTKDIINDEMSNEYVKLSFLTQMPN